LSENDSNEQAIKIALASLATIVKKMNSSIIDLAQNNSIGYDISTKYSEKTNEFFTKLLSSWLISDQVASYFVFDLGGFEFLLYTIGVGAEGEQALTYFNDGMEFEVIESSHEEEKTVDKKQVPVEKISSLFE